MSQWANELGQVGSGFTFILAATVIYLIDYTKCFIGQLMGGSTVCNTLTLNTLYTYPGCNIVLAHTIFWVSF